MNYVINYSYIEFISILSGMCISSYIIHMFYSVMEKTNKLRIICPSESISLQDYSSVRWELFEEQKIEKDKVKLKIAPKCGDIYSYHI